MGCGKSLLNTAEEVAGTAIGFELGGPLGAAAGAGVTSAAQGKPLAQDLIAAGTAGFGSSADIGEAIGLNGSIASSVSNAATDAIGSVGDFASDAIGSIGQDLGITSGNAGTASVAGGAGPSVGAAVAPTAPVSVTPASGAGGTVSAGNLGSFDSGAIESQLNDSLNATGAKYGFDLGTVAPSGAASNSAIGAAGTDAIGSTKPEGSFLSNLESSAGKYALPAAGLAYSAIQGPQKLPSASSSLAPNGAATAPLLNLETTSANEASTGQLTPTQQANIEQGVQQQQNELLQRLASQGITNPQGSTQYQEGLRQIQEWALAQQQNYISQAISAATSAGGAASGNIAGVANQQIQLDKDFQDALASAFSAIGGFAGSGARA